VVYSAQHYLLAADNVDVST